MRNHFYNMAEGRKGGGMRVPGQEDGSFALA